MFRFVRRISLRNSAYRHWGTHLLVLMVVGPDIAVFLIDEDSFWGYAISVVTLPAVILAVLLLFGHMTGPLCEDCARALPVNAPQRADSYKKILHYVHITTIDDPRRRIPIVATLMLFMLMYPLLIDGTAENIASLTFGLLISADLLSLQTHHRYEPWCPWCRNDDGGDDITLPDPGPHIKHPA